MRLQFNKLAGIGFPALFIVFSILIQSIGVIRVYAAGAESVEPIPIAPLSMDEFNTVLESGVGWERIRALTDKQALALSHFGGISISDDLISYLERQESEDSPEKAESLTQISTVEIQELLGIGAVLPLFSLEKLSDRQAEYLSRFGGHLILLWNLGALSESQARELAQFRGDWNYAEIDLRGLSHLPERSAKALSKFTGDRLNLDGLKRYDDSRALPFELFECEAISLNGLSRLTLNQARALGSFSGEELSLNGIEGLTTLQARALAGFEGAALSLQGITMTDDAIISELSKFGGRMLNLNGLKYLSEGQAKSLAGFSGSELRLSGLRALSDTQAEEFGAAKCRALYLDGVTWLSDYQATSLSLFAGSMLSLRSLNQVDISALQNFAGDDLYLTALTELNGAKVNAILDFRARMVWLSVSRIVSDKNFARLRTSDSIGLVMPQVTSIKRIPLQLLMTWRGGLEFNSVTKLDKLFLPALAAWYGSVLHLDGVRELQAKQASALSKFQCGALSVDGLLALTDSDIENLIQFAGKAIDGSSWSRRSRVSFVQKQFDEQNRR